MIKMGFAVASALGLLWALDKKKVKATFGEYTTKDCRCYQVEYFADGTTKSTEVDRERCMADEGLRAELAGCGTEKSNTGVVGGLVGVGKSILGVFGVD